MLDRLFKKYYFLNFTKKEFYEIVKEEMSKVKNLDDIEKLKEIIIKKLDTLAYQQIMNNTVSDKLDEFFGFEGKNKLIKLMDFIARNNIEINNKLIYNLIINSEKLSSILDNEIFNINSNYFIDFYYKYFKKRQEKINGKNSYIVNKFDFLKLYYNMKYGSEECKIELKPSEKKYIKSLDKFEVLTKEEINELFIQANQGDKTSKDKLICNYLWDVVMIAFNYYGMGIPFEDLIQEGNKTLLEIFNTCKNSNNLLQVIDTKVNNSLIKLIASQSKNISFPLANCKRFIRIQNLINNSNNTYNSTNIAQILNIPIDKVDDLLKFNTLEVDIEEIIKNPKYSNCSLLDIEENIENKIQAEQLINLFYILQPEEISILMKYFGFYGRCWTQQELCEELKVSRKTFSCILTSIIIKIKREYKNNIQQTINEEYSNIKFLMQERNNYYNELKKMWFMQGRDIKLLNPLIDSYFIYHQESFFVSCSDVLIYPKGKSLNYEEIIKLINVFFKGSDVYEEFFDVIKRIKILDDKIDLLFREREEYAKTIIKELKSLKI